jgi:1-acyl-sn-glycerol-3-phosphate acyltransferase
VTLSSDVTSYIARQHRYRWRRQFLRGLIRTVGFHLLAKVEVDGLENIPDTGPVILMMSHIALIDPVVCLGVVTNRFVIPMTKVENLHNPIFGVLVRGWGAYTVDRSTIDRSALLNSVELLKTGHMILIAPEGTRSPDGLKAPHEGLVLVATKANALIVPAAMSEAVDYAQRWRKLKRARAHVTFGRPFRFKQVSGGRVTRTDRALMMEEAMYQLARTQPNPKLRGIYSDLDKATTSTLEFA